MITVVLLTLWLTSCGDDQGATQTSSSHETMVEYFAKLDQAWLGHLERLDSARHDTSFDYGEPELMVFDSIEQTLAEVNNIKAPPEVLDPQRRFVTAFHNLVDEWRRDLANYSPAATYTPEEQGAIDQGEFPESESKLKVDEACEELREIADLYAIESRAFCLSDSE